MPNKIFFFILLLFIKGLTPHIAFTQENISYYDKLVDSTKTWYISEHPDYCRECFVNHKISLQEDTLINTNQYFAIMDSIVDSTKIISERIGFIRESQDKKVFWLRTIYDRSSEILLYDFNAKVGQSFGKWKVTQVDSVNIFGIIRLQIKLVNSCFQQNKIWVEGIGNLADIFTYGSEPVCDEKSGTVALIMGGSGYVQVCVKKNENLIFKNPAYIDCMNYNFLYPKNTNTR